MPGKARRKYDGETTRIAKLFTRPLNLIEETLYPDYTKEDLLDAFKKYYTYEWKSLCERQQNYKQKDNFIKNTKGRIRYNPSSPEQFFYFLPKVKNLLSKAHQERYKASFDEVKRAEAENLLTAKRNNRIHKRSEAITSYTLNEQRVDPGFIDALIYAYHCKGNTTNDKLEIFKEIQKYNCDKTVEFFYKINDSERNDEIRHLAFQHLQASGHYVKLRKEFDGKRKNYQVEKDTFYGTPEKLYDKLGQEDSVQSIKSYDVFVSHSSRDKEQVRNIVQGVNKLGMNCYVDWTADNDFLKRSMVSDYTKEVLKRRMQQSKRLLFLSSSNSRKSPWVDFELRYYKEQVKKDIFMLVLDGTDGHDFKQVSVENLEKIV